MIDEAALLRDLIISLENENYHMGDAVQAGIDTARHRARAKELWQKIDAIIERHAESARTPAVDVVAALRAVGEHEGIKVSCDGDDAAETWNRLCRAVAAMQPVQADIELGARAICEALGYNWKAIKKIDGGITYITALKAVAAAWNLTPMPDAKEGATIRVFHKQETQIPPLVLHGTTNQGEA